MPGQVESALQALKKIGTVAALKQQAAGAAPAERLKVNAHIHLPPNFSAFETVQQAIDLAADQGVGVLGVSNYYDYDVYGQFVELARQRGIFPLFGLEIICMVDDLRQAGVKINDPGNPGKMYICGKGITRFSASSMTPEGKRLLDLIRRNDSTRMDAMVRATERVFASSGMPTGTTTDDVVEMIVRRHGSARPTIYLQERHIAQAFQEAAFARIPAADRIAKLGAVFGAAARAKSPDDSVVIQNDLRSHLMKAGKPAFVEETFITFADAQRLILELGGFPCYPVLADGIKPICQFEDPVEQLIEHIGQRNIHAAEFIPIRNSVEVLRRYVTAMHDRGLVITAGTEHNTLDLIPVEPTCLNGVPIPDDLKEIFWEGACVVAAHQFLTLNGEAGFVDARGNRNASWKTAELARLGATVIARYRNT